MFLMTIYVFNRNVLTFLIVNLVLQSGTNHDFKLDSNKELSFWIFLILLLAIFRSWNILSLSDWIFVFRLQFLSEALFVLIKSYPSNSFSLATYVNWPSKGKYVKLNHQSNI